MQTRRASIVEALTNVAIGYGVAQASQFILFPLYDIDVPISTNLALGAWFTVVSIVRSYCLRRVFTRRTETGVTVHSPEIYSKR